MLFTELRYVLFFGVAFAVHWLLRDARIRKRWLLVCSYVFYAGWDWRFCGLILLSTVVDFYAGRRIGGASSQAEKRRWLWFSLSVNLGMLGFFKYFNFFISSGAGLFDLFGWAYPLRTLEIVLPVGISFYTFQTLSYSIDIYRRAVKPVDDFVDFALFVGFFPQLVAGPIVRAVEFLPQLTTPRRLATVEFRACATLFLIGYFKKACIADNLAPIVDAFFAAPSSYDVHSSWTALGLYTIQIYSDFSGYSDMAIASAGFLGYRLRQNFDFPFFSPDVQEFWRRWHMSLSHWCRDYVFFSLMKVWRKRHHAYVNLALTMLVIGFWHGAGWNYILFGAVHALALVLTLAWQRRRSKRPKTTSFGWLGVPATYLFFVCTAVLFRPSGWEPTLAIYRNCLTFRSDGIEQIDQKYVLLWPALALLHWVSYRGWLARPWRALPAGVAYFCLGAGAALALQWAAKDYQPFVYFQF